MSIPLLGLGTFRLKDQVVIDSVTQALEVGYRAIDTAQIYGNEAEVGQAIAASGVARDQLFLTSKIWTENLAGNLKARDLRLSEQDMARIQALDSGLRLTDPQGLAPAWD